jgi:hypothetical protein
MVKLALAVLLALPLLAQTVISVCASGCTQTTVSGAVTAALAAQVSSCAPVIIALRAGETFAANRQLPTRACAQPIILRSDRLAALPSGRATPSDSANMPTIRPDVGDPTNTVFSVLGNNYRFEGLLIETVPGAALNFRLVEVGNVQHTGAFPRRIAFRRMVMRGQNQQDGPGRAISIEACSDCEISDSYIYEAKNTGADAQAILCVQCDDVKIRNNYLEAAGEVILAGGTGGSGNSLIATPGFRQTISAIGNHMAKRPEWVVRTGAGAPAGSCLTGSYYRNTSTNQWHLCAAGTWGAAGTGGAGVLTFVQKNIYEHKDGFGFVLGNRMDRGWNSGQSGYAVLGNQTGNTTNYQIGLHVRFNTFNDVNHAFSIGRLEVARAGTVLIEHNNFTLSPFWSRSTTPTAGAVLYSNTARTISLERIDSFLARRNTFVLSADGGYTHSILSPVHDNYATPPGWGSVTLRENVFDGINYQDAAYSDGFGSTISGSGGLSSICDLASTVVEAGGSVAITNNVFVRQDARLNASNTCPGTHRVPAGNLLPTTIATALTAPASGDYSIKSGYAAIGAAADGGDLGAHQPAIAAMTGSAVSGAANGWLDVGVRSASIAAGGSGTIRYVMPTRSSTCSVAVSAAEVFTAIGSVSQTTQYRTAAATITGAAGAQWLRITCDGTTLPPERLP